MSIMCILYSVTSFTLLYFLYRNNWVYKERIKLIHIDMSKYDKLPSYDYMLYCKPFTWNINKFL